MAGLAGKTLFVTGASRGIGKAIALRAARDGANVVVAAKTTGPHPKLPGTIHTAAAEVEAAGGRALAVATDIRFEEQVRAAVDRAVEIFGGIDVLVNNASAISLTGTLRTEMKRYDLMQDINARGSFLCAKLCLPHLRRAENPHILSISPPLHLRADWFGPHAAYTLAKLAMSLWVLAWAEEFRAEGIAVNALWPRTVVATAAVQNLLGGDEVIRRSRRPEIVADAVYEILTRNSRSCTGNFFIDEDVLREAGVVDFTCYAVDPSVEPLGDFFVG
ncbi:SDR family oxidoreductase [Limnochorda pilosa]|uniref:Short-chain dehydrogenase n=1 Tax=Limnochorda pilosa TaxID=1555112 RepID=A0A0K2SGF5_LIMPI|nr:NAD(P)-dependent oxidoreductase [Limnochorda pilosa]BAS26181.1 short-chain dehydrogenase [Limnochorda pilosa]